MIHGDLDSIREDVREYYQGVGVQVLQNGDQESTDFGKAMRLLSSMHAGEEPQRKERDVIVLGTVAGRVDQGIGLLHEMIREETRNPDLRIWLFSESSVTFILRSRYSVIKALRSSGYFTPMVGILPVYGPVTITTHGLEWDVTDWKSQMGGQVSTSNHVVRDEVSVQSSAPVLFTIERAYP